MGGEGPPDPTARLVLRAPRRHHGLILRTAAFLTRPGGEEAIRHLLEGPAELPLGLFRSEEAALRFLSGTIMMACAPKEIWLFGSRARGTARPDSDVDLLVVMPDGQEADLGALVRAIAPGGVATDILECSVTEFAEHARSFGTIVAAVHGHGRRLYADKDTVRAERAARRAGEPDGGRDRRPS